MTASEQAARARLDAYATSPETKARFAAQAEWFQQNMAAGSTDSSGNRVETLISALQRAAR